MAETTIETYEQHPTIEQVVGLPAFKRHFKTAERNQIEWKVCTKLRSTCSLPVRRYHVTMLVAFIGDRAVRGYSLGRDGSVLTCREPMAVEPI